MIATHPFGKTGHNSSRTLFGGAAFKPTTDQKTADRTLEVLLEFGVNHIDTAHSYGQGNSEKVIGPWMQQHRDRFFLATKTGERTRDGAQKEFALSQQRLQVDQVDLIQMHNLTDEEGWNTAFGPGGALEALEEAREQGKVRFIGVTGHGLVAPVMHLRSIERYPFDSVLLPWNYVLWSNAEYRDNFARLQAACEERQVAIQIIKSIARRPWGDRERSRGPWYQPLEEPADIDRAVSWVLSFPGVFLNTAADEDLLPRVLDAAQRAGQRPSDADMEQMVADREMAPIFVEHAGIN